MCDGLNKGYSCDSVEIDPTIEVKFTRTLIFSCVKKDPA